ncbi:MAG TPA: helix-turn-helix transcriptional regulator [Actinomycetota bacterium]|nr:helix-turn-helix transcriptional regulator [Actinomycetota bacterium]
MHGGELIREARKRAGLTQRELAELLATTQPVVARWENGKTSPSFERVVQAIRACGLDLGVRIVTSDDDHAAHILENLRVPAAERLRRMVEGQAAVAALAAKVRAQSDVV